MYKIHIFDEDYEDYEDEVFEAEEVAHEYMAQLMIDRQTGAEILNLSNPGDYPYDEDDDFDIDYEVIKI